LCPPVGHAAGHLVPPGDETESRNAAPNERDRLVKSAGLARRRWPAGLAGRHYVRRRAAGGRIVVGRGDKPGRTDGGGRPLGGSTATRSRPANTVLVPDLKPE